MQLLNKLFLHRCSWYATLQFARNGTADRVNSSHFVRHAANAPQRGEANLGKRLPSRRVALHRFSLPHYPGAVNEPLE